MIESILIGILAGLTERSKSWIAAPAFSRDEAMRALGRRMCGHCVSLGQDSFGLDIVLLQICIGEIFFLHERVLEVGQPVLACFKLNKNTADQ